MTSAVPDILARIVAHKKMELANSTIPVELLEERARARRAARRDFKAALDRSSPAIVAEIKKASPSKGVLSPDFDPSAIAAQYESGGAAALSVLTDQHFFQGTLDDLERARASVELPVLRKDFTVSSYHVVEAAAAGADAILLIAAILTEGELRFFRELASSYGMSAIVEVHDVRELAGALASGADIVGVNNRNLHTFGVSLDTSIRMAEEIPAGVTRLTESGIQSRADMDRLRAAGYNAFLVGEHLMRSGDPRAALRELIA